MTEFNYDKFYKLIEAYSAIFPSVRQVELELAGVSNLPNPSLDIFTNDPREQREHALSCHLSSFTDMQNFLMKQIHGMLKEAGYKGFSADEMMFPFNVDKAAKIWDAIDTTLNEQNEINSPEYREQKRNESKNGNFATIVGVVKDGDCNLKIISEKQRHKENMKTLFDMFDTDYVTNWPELAFDDSERWKKNEEIHRFDPKAPEAKQKTYQKENEPSLEMPDEEFEDIAMTKSVSIEEKVIENVEQKQESVCEQKKA